MTHFATSGGYTLSGISSQPGNGDRCVTGNAGCTSTTFGEGGNGGSVASKGAMVKIISREQFEERMIREERKIREGQRHLHTGYRIEAVDAPGVSFGQSEAFTAAVVSFLDEIAEE
ncbi:hypothetical protein KL86PLE_90755 [uncultured Pleomorphomonas sp.]|uniref:Uncharacterized protein n=1 Tax=uncultured Pleomorphomonas sp. TaxID=442121 RepID=A0A212LRA3_9HYPH|nr:hypothetical protein [uncultured Pleomorphomonas sp.]SCM80011.1 hypothetical protein KL86PLE_90755 [uncultured Pleomorphomonas sp.]